MSKIEAPQIANTAVSRRVRQVLGFDLDWWNSAMLLSLALAAVAALSVLVTTRVVIVLQDHEAKDNAEAFARYKLEASERISANEAETGRANEAATQARKDTSSAQERIANLTADNLALQTVLLPRHFGLIGIDGPPKGDAWSASLRKFAGTEISIQEVNDAEAKNLATEITILLSMSGWKVTLIDEKRSNVSTSRIPDGVNVSYPTGKPWTAKESKQPWMAWANAAESLANALTEAGLGVGDKPVSRFGFLDDFKNELLMTHAHFDPPLTGVYLQVGARPVAATVEWIKGGRLDPLGKPPTTSSLDSSNPQ